MPFRIGRNDITKMQVEAIVNPANAYMNGTAGVDGRIHEIEGPWLRETTRQIGGNTKRSKRDGCKKFTLWVYFSYLWTDMEGWR